MPLPNSRRTLLLGGVALLTLVAAGTLAASRFGVPGLRPRPAWGEDRAADIAAFTVEIAQFTPALCTRLDKEAAAKGPSVLAGTDWGAFWYQARVQGAVAPPTDLLDDLADADADAITAFQDYASATLVPHALANVGQATRAHLPSSVRRALRSPPTAPPTLRAESLTMSDGAMLTATRQVLDTRLAQLATAASVPLESVQPAAELVAAADASASMHSAETLRLLMAYEEAFAKAGGTVSTAPKPARRAAAARPPAPAKPPNVLILDIDTLSADRMDKKYGDEWVLPTLHGLADRGVRFTQMVAQAGWTVPALMSLLTGRYPLSLDLTQPTAMLTESGAPLLPDIFGHYGYQSTAMWSKGVPQVLHGLEGGFTKEVLRDELVGDAAEPMKPWRDWIAAAPSQPFLLLVHDFDLQIPGDRFTGDEAHHFGGEGIPCLTGELDETYDVLEGPLGAERAREHTLRHYDGAAHAYDALLGQFLRELDEAGLLDNTVVLVTSNHGEDFADHAEGVTHGAMFDTVLRVPLIVAGPGVTAKGRVVDAPVQTVDLAPTLLELAGIPVEARMVGQSLLPLLTGGEPGPEFADRAIFSLTNDRTMAVRTPTRKVIFQDWGDSRVTLSTRDIRRPHVDRRVSWYDLATDPGERTDRFPTEPERALDLLQALMGFRADRIAVATSGQGVSVDPELREIFRANGYWSIASDGKEVEGTLRRHGPSRAERSGRTDP